MEQLLDKYATSMRLQRDSGLAAAQRVWFVVYPPSLERNMRLRIDDFQTATLNAGKRWKQIDITSAFGAWLGTHRYKEAYFGNPAAIEPALGTFANELTQRVVAELGVDADQDTVVALTGVGSIFGAAKLSEVLQGVTAKQLPKGRLVVFFPGHKEAQRYRLLGASDGWDYLGIAITLERES